MDGNLKRDAVMLLARLLMIWGDKEIGEDESITPSLQMIEDKLHEVYALGIEAGREGA